MVYRIRHQTTYRYDQPANLCHNEARLRPRDLPGQRLLDHRLSVTPGPDFQSSRTDGFGNHIDYFAIQRPHEQLVITAESRVEMRSEEPLPLECSTPWNEVPTLLGGKADPGSIEARELTLPSPFVPRLPSLADLTDGCFPAGRPLLEAVAALNERIFDEFEFKPGFTDVSTPVSTVLETRAGVCQDFAHLMLAALRWLHLPARYVSGYLETLPPPGKDKLVGADASHAWISVHVPGHGWADFDPTNNLRPSERHLVTAVGRDYGDVAPLRGVTTAAAGHRLEVAVDVNPE